MRLLFADNDDNRNSPNSDYAPVAAFPFFMPCDASTALHHRARSIDNAATYGSHPEVHATTLAISLNTEHLWHRLVKTRLQCLGAALAASVVAAVRNMNIFACHGMGVFVFMCVGPIWFDGCLGVFAGAGVTLPRVFGVALVINPHGVIAFVYYLDEVFGACAHRGCKGQGQQ